MTFSYFTSRQVFRSALLFFFLLAVLTTSSGKSIKMITSWFNPNYEGQTFHKILVIGVAQNPEGRADFEDEMAAQIARAGIETIPGNHILLRPDPNVKLDLDYLRGQIRDNHIDAIVHRHPEAGNDIDSKALAHNKFGWEGRLVTRSKDQEGGIVE